MNTMILSGNLGKDPETFFSGDGDPITKFSMAFKFGKDKTGWVKVTCFNKQAELAEKYLHKGAKIAVTGMLDQDKWTTEGGENRTMIKVIARQIEFIKTNGKGFEGGDPQANGSQMPQEEDIPF